jgi:hypothetical protein
MRSIIICALKFCTYFSSPVRASCPAQLILFVKPDNTNTQQILQIINSFFQSGFSTEILYQMSHFFRPCYTHCPSHLYFINIIVQMHGVVGYLCFEFSLIPTVFLLLGWEYQPERLQAEWKKPAGRPRCCWKNNSLRCTLRTQVMRMRTGFIQ